MGTITIVGLGPGAVGHLSLETMGLLQNCAQVILRTAVHPTVAELEKQNVKFTSCDDLYEKAASFEEVYNSVVERVLAAAQNGDVVYAVPGSPLVAEKTVVLMRTAAKAQGIKLAVVTSKKPPMLRRGLDCLQLTQYFDETIALGDTKESKPHPEPMLAACAKLGLQAEECLCVGDSPFDLQSGRSAGAQTVAVRYTAFGWEKLLEEGRPDFVIGRPQELLEIVGKNR